MLWVVSSAMLVFCLALECKPSWYRPAVMDDTVLRRAKVESAELVEFIGTHLVVGDPFDAVLTQASINDMAAALSVLSPEAAERIPREIVQFAAAFEAGSLRFGFLAERGGWRAIVNVEVGLEVAESSDDIIVTLRDVRIGAVSVPRWALRRVLDERLRTEAARSTRGEEGSIFRGRVEPVEAWTDGVRVPNRFTWPNGRRPFRIERVTMECGEARVRIRPL